jgi:signal transduction histidine kinase
MGKSSGPDQATGKGTWRAGRLRKLLRSADSPIRRWALALPPWIGSAAIGALVAVLVSLVFFGGWADLRTNALSANAQQAANLNDSYQDARFAVAEEEVLRLKYRQSPDVALKVKHEQAGAALVADLAAVNLIANADLAAVRRLSIAHARYLDASLRMFDEVDAGNLTGADNIARDEIAPIFSQIDDLLNQEAIRYDNESVAALQSLSALRMSITRVGPVVVGLSLLLIGFLTLVLEVNRRARDAKSFFLARVSHELRTPLNSILGFSQLILVTQSATLNDKGRRYVHNIHSSGLHLLDLINDVLDLSKAEAGKMAVELVPTAVDGVIEAALEEVAPLITARQLDLQPITGIRGLTISADQMRLRQVLLNGLSNAIKFTDAGGSITVATRSTKDSVSIDIGDTGRGIPADQLDRMFEEFEQLDNSRSRRGEGTGIGLPLSKALVEMMGGKLTLTSREGIGTTFHVLLPMAARSTAVSPADAPPKAPLALSLEVAYTALPASNN